MKKMINTPKYHERRSKNYEKTFIEVKQEIWLESFPLTESLWPRVVFESERCGYWHLKRKKFPFLAIELMLGGRLKYEIEEHDVFCDSGDIHITPYGSNVDVYSPGTGYCKRLGIELYGNLVVPIAQSFGLTNTASFKPKNFRDLEKKLRLIMRLLGNKLAGTQAEVSTLCYDLLATISSQLYPQEVSSIPQQLNKPLDIIHSNLDMNYTVEQLATEANCSVSTLIRLFKGHLGQTPIDYINNYKMEHAKHLLHLGELSVKQISALLGFKDQFYFSRVFNKVFGVRPSKIKDTYDIG